ncbi:MAG: hypothetical protein R3F03_08815 [Opitutaceae bacterium]
MSDPKSKTPRGEALTIRNPGCLDMQEVPPVCLRLHSHRQRIALPYALLLSVELAADEVGCVITFATHEVRVRGRYLQTVYTAVSQGQAVQISVGDSGSFSEGDKFLGPLVTDIKIESTDELDRSRR